VVEKVAAMVEDGETLSTRDVKGIIDSRPMGKATYWQPEPAHTNGTAPTDEDTQAEAPAQPSAPKSADRSLTAEQTEDMMRKAIAERDDCPELESYRGAGWAIYLADTYAFWPTVDTTKQAIAAIVRKMPKPAPAQKALDQSDTEAVIDRVLVKDFATDTQRLAYLDKAGPNAYTHALRPGVHIDPDIFDAARAAIRAEISERIAKEQAKAEAEAQRRQEAARVEAVRHDKQTMLYGLRRALAELPEAAEDTYYDLTGATLYSTARQAITNAIKELENTMEAERV
jgi:chaperonin cofactor prefoldin